MPGFLHSRPNWNTLNSVFLTYKFDPESNQLLLECFNRDKNVNSEFINSKTLNFLISNSANPEYIRHMATNTQTMCEIMWCIHFVFSNRPKILYAAYSAKNLVPTRYFHTYFHQPLPIIILTKINNTNGNNKVHIVSLVQFCPRPSLQSVRTTCKSCICK